MQQCIAGTTKDISVVSVASLFGLSDAIKDSANFKMEITCFLFPAMWTGYPFALFLLRCIMFRVSDRVVYIIYNTVVWLGERSREGASDYDS